MIQEDLRRESVSLRNEDLRVRQELAQSGELGGTYVPRMEAVHVANAARLRELIVQHGWPTEDIAGKDGAEAARFIAQHAIGAPQFQHEVLPLLRESSAKGCAPAWHAAYLEDRIALYEGRPQSFGSQWLEDARDGRLRPWKLADTEHVDEIRASAGPGALASIPEPGPDLPEEQRKRI